MAYYPEKYTERVSITREMGKANVSLSGMRASGFSILDSVLKKDNKAFMLIIRCTLLLVLLVPGVSLAQVTTLAQQEAIWDSLLTSAKSDSSTLVANIKSFVPQYGNYCGLQTAAAGALPIDCVDGACFQHDTSPGYSLATPTLAQVVQADRQFIANLSFTQASTPYGELYRNVAIQVFDAKTTYEQANSVTLVTPCKDCLSQP
jgi:hypothetical protein